MYVAQQGTEKVQKIRPDFTVGFSLYYFILQSTDIPNNINNDFLNAFTNRSTWGIHHTGCNKKYIDMYLSLDSLTYYVFCKEAESINSAVIIVLIALRVHRKYNLHLLRPGKQTSKHLHIQ